MKFIEKVVPFWNKNEKQVYTRSTLNKCYDRQTANLIEILEM